MTPIDWLIPGYGHFRHGFRRQAVKYAVFLGAWLSVIVLRPGRIGDIVAGSLDWIGADGVVALVVLAAWPILWMLAARRGLRKLLAPPELETLSQWQISSRLLGKNQRAMIGLQILGFAYTVALWCPILADYDPERLPTGFANKKASPFTTIYVVGHKEQGEIFCRDFFEDPEDASKIVLYMGEDAPQDEIVAAADLGEPKRGWEKNMPPNRVVEMAGHEIPFRSEFHILGTDDVGRDLFAELLYGSRISLTIGFVAMFIAVSIGSVVGVMAGYLGGFADVALMRFVDILLAFPRLLLLLLIYAAYAATKQEVSIFLIVAILGATGWMGISRLVRAQILSLREQDFTTAARALGLSKSRIMFRHLLPNATAPIIVDATLRVGNTILLEASLSFLGMGVQKPTP
ncbi:MAG: ABC transporter permease, partial [Planctomycetota bacterium]